MKTKDVERPVDRRRFQFGLRGLLIAVTVLALGIGWIGHLNRRAQNRTKLTGELAQAGVLVDLEEPTGTGQLARKFSPQSESWLRGLIGSGWLSRPTVFCCWELSPDKVPEVTEHLVRLGTVRELQLRDKLPAPVIAELRRGLPGIDLITNSTATSTYRHSRVSGPQFAWRGVGLLALIAAGMFGGTCAVVWQIRRSMPPSPSRQPG